MSFDVSGIDGSHAFHARGTRPVSAEAPAGATPHPVDPPLRRHSIDAFPASAPPELRVQMLAAQRAVADMRARGRELHFEMTDGRLRIEMRDLDGNVLREIPGREALEIASGRIKE